MLSSCTIRPEFLLANIANTPELLSSQQQSLVNLPAKTMALVLKRHCSPALQVLAKQPRPLWFVRWVFSCSSAGE